MIEAKGAGLGVLGMADKKDDKKEKDPFADSSEIFESIFKEATSEIKKETGTVVAKPGLKPKPKPEARPKPEIRPKAPTKLELESAPESKEGPEQKAKPEPRPRRQPPVFKPRQDLLHPPVTRKTGGEEEAGEDLLSTRPLLRSRIQEKKPEEEQRATLQKPKPVKKKGKSSSILKIILLLVLLAVGVGGASAYLGIIDLSEYIGWPEQGKKEPPKTAAAKPSPAQPAAKTAQPPAPKPAQPAQPQAKPAEAPKPAAPAQTAQPPQPPPKPAEPVTPPPIKEAQTPAVKPEAPVEAAKAASPPVQPPPAVSPPQPPPAQAKPEPPAPPAQTPVKVEPPPVSVQPPAQSPPKIEPKAAPVPVQPPATPKKLEAPQPASQPKEVAAAKAVAPASGTGTGYPYSVYVGSVQGMDFVKKAISSYEGQGISIYWSKVDLGAKGTWYRLFTGYFRTAQEAEGFVQQKRIKDGEVKETRYANLVGAFGGKQAADEKARALMSMGSSAYSIQAADGQVRVYSGAFITREGAEKNQADLNAKGIKSEIAER